MARMGSVDLSELKKFQQNLEKMADEAKINQFCEECAKELAARLLAKVIKRTPVGDYPKGSGRKGGVLRRGWVSNTPEEASSAEEVTAKEQADYIQGIKVTKSDSQYIIEIENPVPYASYVEFGHRQTPGRYVPVLGKCLKESFVPGKKMMTISENEIRQIAPRLLEKKLEKFLEGVFRE